MQWGEPLSASCPYTGFIYTQEKKVAFSFDATWGAEHTPKILETLSRHQVKTTFFLTNIWLEKYPHMAKKIAEEGHEIGLHSTTHPHFTALSQEEMEKELKENYQKVKEITGYEARFFRPPFGGYDDRVIRTCHLLGFQVIQWDVDSLDWQEGMTAEAIKKRVLNGVKPGSIVVFHNNGRYTAEALDPILPELKKRGYEIVPVGQLLLQGEYYIDHTGEQRPVRS